MKTLTIDECRELGLMHKAKVLDNPYHPEWTGRIGYADPHPTNTGVVAWQAEEDEYPHQWNIEQKFLEYIE